MLSDRCLSSALPPTMKHLCTRDAARVSGAAATAMASSISSVDGSSATAVGIACAGALVTGGAERVVSALEAALAPLDLVLEGGACESVVVPAAVVVAVEATVGGGGSRGFGRLDGLLSSGEDSIDLLRLLACGLDSALGSAFASCLGSVLSERPDLLVDC
mgnify:CR=1 FL=1